GGGLIARARRRGGIRLTEGLEIEPSLRRAAEAALGDALRGVALARGELEAVRGEAGVVVLRDAITAASVDPAEVDGAGGPTLTLATRLRELGGGLLVDAIRQDPSRAVRHLLATAVWAPDLEAALSIAEVLPAGWLVATLDGELVGGNGLVRLGGAGGSLLECQAARDSAAAELEQLRQTAKEAADAADAAATETDRGAVALAAARAVLDDVQRGRRAAETQERTAAGHEEAARREQAWEDAQLARLVSLTDRVRADLPADGENEGFGWARAGATSAPPPTDAAPDGLAHVRARAEALRRRRDGLLEQAGRSESERRRSDDERRRIEVRLGLDEARLLELEDQSGRLAETAERARTELGQVTAALASAREEERSASELLDELDRSEAADRTRLVELEQAAAKAREALRAAEERARAEERRELERRLQLEQIGEQLLVELAALGDVGLAAIEAEVAVPASPGAAHAEGAAKPAAASEPAGLEAPDAEEAPGPAEALASELEAIFPVVTAAWRALGEDDQATVDVAGGAGAQLATLRRRYQTLGVSNPFAAREYAEIKARVDELDGQESDLTEAIAGTRQLISELSALVAKQFLDTFTKLEGAFARRFEGLFGGGDASLTLTDPTDLSVTGVEITARPPGKKRQALAMLSGGERTLTAVALLFAMLEIRPVPFCVLDEVDAALDEANVGRFVAALRELAELTQFVVITHNRGTIEAADALYGVTMGEDAVSRVISLRLSSGIDLPAPTPAMATSA
nr:hypothetical protein [Chloroflexota bacterium]